MKGLRALPNYLRMYRKRRGFSEREVSRLLGVKYWSTISRYELNLRLPGLATLLTLEIIYGTEAEELFAGIYDDVIIAVQKRAQQLLKELQTQPSTPAIKRKRDSLVEIITSEGDAEAA